MTAFEVKCSAVAAVAGMASLLKLVWLWRAVSVNILAMLFDRNWVRLTTRAVRLIIRLFEVLLCYYYRGGGARLS